ncbi:hypothetical protein [Deinococcus sp. RM]|uniref:hypothetical protein n=1 Tax=Deinococcus sp. RM TaxID=2316359 RepID=UPI000E688D80|nr:hypothetical protein [Deinococcus sp. RM]RIX98885.1 hypothetical protein D3W47_17415 [Deinococcus sp. RM]
MTFQDWSDWTRDEWTATLRRVRLARQSGLDVVVTFDTSLTLASLPSRVTAAQARGALALLPGPLPDSSLNTARALGILRAAQSLPLVTGGALVWTEVEALIAGTLTDAPPVGSSAPGVAFRLPAPPRLPWKQAAFLEAASALPDRGWAGSRLVWTPGPTPAGRSRHWAARSCVADRGSARPLTAAFRGIEALSQSL